MTSFYGFPDDEQYRFTDLNEFVQDFLDENDYCEGETPDEITIHEMEAAPINAMYFEVLDDLLEKLDEEYSDPDGDSTTPTPAMIAAENINTAVSNSVMVLQGTVSQENITQIITDLYTLYLDLFIAGTNKLKKELM